MMDITEKTVRLAAQLYEARDSVRRLFGDRYIERMADFRKAIEAVQEQLNLDEPLTAATKICENFNGASGFDKLCFIAAACEMIEPSPTSAQQPKGDAA